MVCIDKIEILYFRSIYRETITNLKNLNIFTGKNDVGKSNVLKALNLFFNNETDAGVPFVFQDNFNHERLEEVRKETIKGQQYIQIKVTFIRGSRSEKTLPERFTITKKWLRNDILPSTVLDDVKKRITQKGGKYSDRNKSSLTIFLNKLKYIYVPAIKDDKTFSSILSLLRETIYNDKLLEDPDLNNSMTLLASRISTAAEELNDEFERATSVSTKLTSPKSVSDLYRMIDVETQEGNNTVGLDKRGDGIRVRYLPSILHFISCNSTNLYIWGFEEPENSLEYNLSLKMAQDFVDTYCKKSMIFTTSHSPAFITVTESTVVGIYRCFRDGFKTRILLFSKANKYPPLETELGYIHLQKELFKQYNDKLREMEQVNAQKLKIEEELRNITKPVLYTEGKTDVMILKTAWSKLYTDECPFYIKSCDVLSAESSDSAAGCGVLENLLKSTRPDNPFIFIGLFDRDRAGIKAYGLDANFMENEDGLKAHRNGKSYAILLPVPPGKELFSEFKNLCTEFYFEKDDLEKQVDEHKLRLEPALIRSVFNGVVVEPRKVTEMHLHVIDESTKTGFARHVVPTFSTESFVHFKLLFEKIINIVSNVQAKANNDEYGKL